MTSPVPLALVVAVAENGVIGAAGGLPWRVRADLRRFRALTLGKPMIMGRKTFESIGRVLDGRDSIVVTRRTDLARPGVWTAASPGAAVEMAAERARAVGAAEAAVIGGGEIFSALMPLAGILHVTRIAAAPAGDVVFPEIAAAEWAEVSREALPFSDGDTAAASYAVYRRRI